jgi:hypothetical protein
MPDAARTLAVDGCADREPKRCARCRNPKPRDEFGRNASNPDGYSRYCLWCKRMLSYVDYHEGGGKEAKAAATAPPDVRARRLERDARWRAGRREQRRASSAAYARTPNGRLHKQRSNTLCILRRATDPEKIARLEARIALFVTREGTFKVKVSDGKGSAIQGGTFKTRDEARIAANALGLQLLGIEGYADVPARGRAKP